MIQLIHLKLKESQVHEIQALNENDFLNFVPS
jgi:hypothetical protein